MHLVGLSNWGAPYLSVDNLAGYKQPELPLHWLTAAKNVSFFLNEWMSMGGESGAELFFVYTATGVE